MGCIVTLATMNKGRQYGGDDVYRGGTEPPTVRRPVFLRFKELGPARRLRQVKSYERSSRGEWCDIVGWTDNEDRPECQAMVQPVEESGRGAAYVVFGGVWGLRLNRRESGKLGV